MSDAALFYCMKPCACPHHEAVRQEAGEHPMKGWYDAWGDDFGVFLQPFQGTADDEGDVLGEGELLDIG